MRRKSPRIRVWTPPYLPDDIYAKIPGILKQMTPYAAHTAPVLAGRIPKSKKVFDNSKVTDHHAIIPTGQSPKMLVGEERQMYHLIAMRFISAFILIVNSPRLRCLPSRPMCLLKPVAKVIVKRDGECCFLLTENSGDDNVSAGGDDESILCRNLSKEKADPMNLRCKNRHSRPNHTQKEHCCAPWNLPVKRWMTRNFGKQ